MLRDECHVSALGFSLIPLLPIPPKKEAQHRIVLEAGRRCTKNDQRRSLKTTKGVMNQFPQSWTGIVSLEPLSLPFLSDGI